MARRGAIIIEAADLKLRNALRDAGPRYPRITLSYRWAIRNRIPLLAFLAAVRGALDALAPFISDDLPLFANSGYALITGHFAEVFASSLVQVGPIQLIPFGFVRLLSDHLGIPLGLGLTAPVTVVFTLFAIFVFRKACRWVGREPTAGFELFFGLVIVFGGFSYTVATSAHPAEGFIPLLWILAAIDIRREKPGLAAVWLFLAGAMKLWGVLGAPILLLSPRIRRAALGWAIQASLTVAAYLPFMLSGRVKTFGFSWEVRPQSPLRLFLESGSAFTWKMRIAQGAFIAGVGALIALRARPSKSAFWLVPLALVALQVSVRSA